MERLMLDDLMTSDYKDYKDLGLNEGYSYLKNKESKVIVEDYFEADNKGVYLANKKIIINSILSEFLSDDFIVSEIEGTLVASDSIAGVAGEILNEKLSCILRNLKAGGAWILYENEDSFHLSKKWRKFIRNV